MPGGPSKSFSLFGLRVGDAWPLVLGFLFLAVPTMASLAHQTWSHEDGVQGPLILATGAWLLFREFPGMEKKRNPDAVWGPLALIVLALPVYVFGRAFDLVTLEAGGFYLIAVGLLWAHFGTAAVLGVWFPLLYLAFVVPPPSYLIDQATAPLKHFAAFISTEGLKLAGVPISREGVTIMVGQYQLLIENACSGMNSLMGLTATSLLYIYLMRRAAVWYSGLLLCLVIPVAILANIIRIVIIILITWIFGDEVGQSFIHQAAGLVLFATSLAMIFGVDSLIYPLFHRKRVGA